MARLPPDVGQAGMVQGVSHGMQRRNPEKHLHFFEAVPVEGEEIDDVGQGQAVGAVAVVSLFAAAHPEGAALRRIFHGQEEQVLAAAEPAGPRRLDRQGRRHDVGDETQQGGHRHPPGHPSLPGAGLLQQQDFTALDDNLVADGYFFRASLIPLAFLSPPLKKGG